MSSPAPRNLYRSLLREANRLPYDYLRAFFRIKFRDDISTAVRSKSNTIPKVKAQRLEKELRKLKAANAGNKTAFIRMLDIAYGRIGKLKRELIEPFLTAATAEKPPPIIPGVEKSRPPVYSPELTALLTSLFSRTGKALKPSHLETPPTLPTRADPASEEARYLGPFSKRREVNIRWRYFTVQSKNILPPLQVSIPHIEEPEGNLESDGEVLRGGFQDTGLLDMVEGLTGSMKHPPKPRRERTAAASSANVVLREDSHSLHGDLSTVVLPTRFLRRRHQQLLGRLPLLTYNRDYKKGKGKYEVSLPKRAVSPRLRYASAPKAMIDADNLAWFRRAQEIEKLKTVRK